MIRRPPPSLIPAEVKRAVRERDGICVAAKLGETTPCLSWRRTPPTLLSDWEYDHVREQPPIGTLEKTRVGGYMRRPPHEARFIVLLCFGHHQRGWATSHRPELREYLRDVA